MSNISESRLFGQNDDRVRLWFAIVITLLVSAYWLAIHVLEPLRLGRAPHTSYSIMQWVADAIVVGLLALLWAAHRHWRGRAWRDADLRQVIMNVTREALLVVTPDRTIVCCNAAAQNLFGFSAEEIIGRKTDLLYADLMPGAPEVRARLEAAGLHGGSGTGRRKDGTPLAIELTTTRLQGAQGAVVLIRDMTEQQQADDALVKAREELERRVEHRTAELRQVNERLSREMDERQRREAGLRASESTYRTLTEASPDLIYLLDGECRLLYVNPRAAALLGRPAAELVGMSTGDFLPAEIGARHRDAIRQVFEQRKPLTSGVPEHFVRTDAWYDTRLIPIVNERGATTAVLGISRDVTEHRRIESALRESEENFRTLVENAMSGILLVSKSNHVLYANRKGAEITGNLSPDYLMGADLQALLPAFEWKNGSSSRNRKTPAHLETVIVRADGVRVPVDVAAAPTLWKGEPGTLLVFHDITARKDAEAQMVESQTKLRILASELSLAEERERRRIAISLHDGIGQTLALCKIKLGAAMAAPPSAPNAAAALAEIQRWVDDAILETRALTAELSPPVLYEMGLEGALEWLAERMAQQYAIPVLFRSDSQPKPLDDSLRVVLFQAVRELVVNAIKHAKPKRIRISSHRVQAKIHLAVEDDGVGFNASQPDGRPRRQTGFGLFYIRERMIFLGGHMLIDSRSGRGARVMLTAPLKRESVVAEARAP